MGRPLTQVEQDLNKYAQEKGYKLILDVVQAFDIAGKPKSAALACTGATLLRIAATLAVHCNADRARWIVMCNEVYDQAQQVKKEEENNDA